MDQGKYSIQGMVYAAMFGAMTAVGAYIIIPLPPVPMTMQTFFTCLAASLLGGSLGALSQVVYVLLGCIGLPVFAGGKGGLGVILGPTGGYLMGFIVAAYVMGKLIGKKKEPGFAWIALSMSIGHVVIFMFGVTQLAYVTQLSASKAIAVGILPFIPGSLVKILIATFVTLKLRDRMKLKR